MDADATEAHPGAARPAADAKAAQPDEHERDVEDREAFEAWGYMFKPDKTGTDKLKALLRGLKNVIVCDSVTSCNNRTMRLIVSRTSTTNHRTIPT
jgi:hypothetical protein